MCEFSVFPSLKYCCFCVSLRLSSVLIAFFYTFLSVPLLIIYGTPIVLFAPMEESTRYFFYITSLSLIGQFFTGCVLIYAAIQKSPWLFPAWIWLSFCQSAALVLLAMSCTFIYIYQVTKGLISDNPEEAITYTVYMIYGFVLYYAVSVVNSYKKQLLEAETAAEDNDGQVESLPLGAV